MLVILRLSVVHDLVTKWTSVSVNGTLMVSCSSSMVRSRPSLAVIGHETGPHDVRLSPSVPGETCTELFVHPSVIPILVM